MAKEPTTTVVKIESYDISRSDETLALATDLARFIVENKLSSNVQGKQFVNVEGWQYAGSRLGILPIVREVVNLTEGAKIKYSARVELFDLRSRQVVGAGFAICDNAENGKKFYAEYAIASMAQTRAIGKAYRNCLAWIIRAAGYEPTPAEEMDYVAVIAESAPPAPSTIDYATPLHAAESLPALAAAWAAVPKAMAAALLSVKDAAKVRLTARPPADAGPATPEQQKALLDLNRRADLPADLTAEVAAAVAAGTATAAAAAALIARGREHAFEAAA